MTAGNDNAGPPEFTDRPGRDQVVLIVEDHDVMRDALVDVVQRMHGFAVGASVESAEAALAVIDELSADLALIDFSLPGLTGDDLVRRLGHRRPGLRCVVLSGHREATYVDRAIRAGADGYVVKGFPDEIEVALRVVGRGESYVSPSLDRRAR